MSEPVVKIRDIAYVRLRVPDLDRMEAYLLDFGMETSARTDAALYMRGTGASHHLHISEKADEAGLAAIGFLAADAADLDRLAAMPGASAVHGTGEPGGGRRVAISDPWGNRIELVHGIAGVEPRSQAEAGGLNLGRRVERKGAVKRTGHRPAQVMRLGHAGINVADPDEAFAWYHRHFGILKSDSIAMGDFALAHFCRCDRGSQFTDHHTFLLARSMDGTSGFNHVSYEVTGLDEIWVGHRYLAERGYRHNWGIGRHTLGSQIFDYWRDPWGQIHEHYTDGDLLDAACEPGVHSIEEGGSQWGPEMPPDFGRTVPS
ncbi:MAG TPA: VOC family protein [Candidatus Binatia bacterium]|jgi:catechol 2,3-dioxygenase-like lactoylglutathione lyase family enzyme